jgi:hypothetical protein
LKKGATGFASVLALFQLALALPAIPVAHISTSVTWRLIPDH